MVTKSSWTPNALTLETMAKSERGEDVHHAKDAEDLFWRLGIGGDGEGAAGLSAAAQERASGRDDKVVVGL